MLTSSIHSIIYFTERDLIFYKGHYFKRNENKYQCDDSSVVLTFTFENSCIISSLPLDKFNEINEHPEYYKRKLGFLHDITAQRIKLQNNIERAALNSTNTSQKYTFTIDNARIYRISSTLKIATVIDAILNRYNDMIFITTKRSQVLYKGYIFKRRGKCYYSQDIDKNEIGFKITNDQLHTNRHISYHDNMIELNPKIQSRLEELCMNLIQQEIKLEMDKDIKGCIKSHYDRIFLQYYNKYEYLNMLNFPLFTQLNPALKRHRQKTKKFSEATTLADYFEGTEYLDTIKQFRLDKDDDEILVVRKDDPKFCNIDIRDSIIWTSKHY